MSEHQAMKALLRDRWGADREEAQARRIARTLHRRRRARQLVASATVAATVACIVAVARSMTADLPPLRFADGSTSAPLGAQTRLVALVDTPRRVTVSLEQGAALFDVVPDPQRTFRVEAGAVVVEVVGTRFTVERLPTHVRVAVERGLVRVSGQLLAEGQSGLFPVAGPPKVDVGTSPRESAEDLPPRPRELERAPARRAGPTSPPDAATPPSHADWRALARRGDFEVAWGRLEAGALVRDESSELLLASDVARLTRHPNQAVAYLRRLLASHRDDPRAPLAAFTLGRVLLDELGWPRDAAAAFATARALDAGGPLAEDALGREVEAWSRAGDPDRARELAEQYLASYPGGARASSVRRHGGL